MVALSAVVVNDAYHFTDCLSNVISVSMSPLIVRDGIYVAVHSSLAVLNVV